MNLAVHNRMLLKIEKEKRKEKELWRDIKGDFLDAIVKIIVLVSQKLFIINWQAFSRQTFFGSKGSHKGLQRFNEVHEQI